MNQIKMLISAGEIRQRIAELSEEISNDYKGKELCLLCVLKGGVMFLTDIARSLDMDVRLDFMDVSSYEGITSSGKIKINKDLSEDIDGKHVILVEDIVDTGRTLSHLMPYLIAKNPASLKVCTLLDKPARREVENVNPDYKGFVIPDEFVVGYGLDYDEKYRNLPYIGVLSE